MTTHRGFGAFALLALTTCSAAGGDWPQFGGPKGRSISDEKSLPVDFEDETRLAWKVPLPGGGPSGPIVVGDRVLVTGSDGARQQRLHVACYDAETGQHQWHREMWATGHTVCHPFGGVAAPTPASDGQRVFAFFSSNDLVCFDLDGNLLWLRGLAFERPMIRNDVGMASSPLVVGGVVIAQMQSQSASWVMGIDAATGETRWELQRELGAMWTSPTLMPGESADQNVVLLQSRSHFSGHDPQTGKELWRQEVDDPHSMATVTTSGDRVFLPANGMAAFQLDRQAGGVKFLWHEQRIRCGSPSPVVYDGRIYTISGAVLVCGDADSGEVLERVRLEGPIWATPVIADGHLYAVSNKGVVQVVRLGENPEVVGKGQLDQGILASPAVAHCAIYFRSDEHLWKFARP